MCYMTFLFVTGSDGGDEGLDEDTQNQMDFWLDETTGGGDGDYQAGLRGHEHAGGHDDVSSLHEDDEQEAIVDDAQVLSQVVRR